MARRYARTGLAIAIVAIAALVAGVQLCNLTAKQQPAIWHDSHTFLEIAAQPLAFDHLFYPKPLVAPAVERILGDPESIASFQVVLAFSSWLVLAAVLLVVMRRWASRITGVIACGAFLLAPARVGFTAAVASESIDDSLRTLAIAAAIALVTVATRVTKHRALACSALSALLVVVTAAWIFTRDTNAIIAITGVALAMWRGSPRQWWHRDRWAVVTASAITISAILSIWSSQVVPRQPLGLSLTDGWAPESTARGSFALVDDFMIRVMTDPAARQRAIDEGLPWSGELDHYIGTGAYGDFLSEPRYAPTRAWIFSHGTSTYLGWLGRHPLQRVEEVVSVTWNVLTPHDMGVDYMPVGWRADHYGGLVVRMFRSLTESPALVLALLLAAPLLWRRARALAIAPTIVCLVWSAIVGIFAAYYGDAMEMVRHAWGPSQQLILGLVLVVVARLDTPAIARDTATHRDHRS